MKAYSLKSRKQEWPFLYILIPICFVILPALFAINIYIPCLESGLRTCLFTKLLPQSTQNLLEMPFCLKQFWSIIKSANFDPLSPLVKKSFIVFNNACFLLPFTLFIIIILSCCCFKKRMHFCVFVTLSLIFLIGLITLAFLGIDEILSRYFIIRITVYGFLTFYFFVYFVVVISWIYQVICHLFNTKNKFYLPALIQKICCDYYIAHRYFLMYIYLRHPVAFFVGILYNLTIYLYLTMTFEKPEKLPALALFGIWSSSLAMWLLPFIMAWLQIFRMNFIDEYYRNTISTNISALSLRKKGHRVLLGYGRLGQGVHKELLERRTASVKIEPLLDPSDGTTIIYLRKDMVVVDRDEKIFDHVFTDPSFEKIGVAKIKYRDIKPEENCQYTFSEEELWAPAIIGDIANVSVLDYSNLESCEFFIDTVKGYDETLKIARVVHDYRNLKGIITVSDSAQKELLFPRYSGHGLFFTYVKRQQGISLGETVYPAMLRWLKQEGNPRPLEILVLTDDIRQTHYMIETIVQELKLAGRLNQYIRACVYPNIKQYDLGITICGNSEEIRGACHPHDPQERREPDFTLDVRRWNACIERCSGPEHADPPNAIYVSSRVILEHPYLTTMEKMVCVYDIKPDIVVISFREPSRLLKTLRDWVGTYQRNSKLFKDVSLNKYKPVIIAGSLGEEQREVRDVLFYYDALPPDAMQSRYPVQAIDCRVDLYKDSREHIAAIADALSKKEAEKEEAIGIHMMIQNRSGITPDILAALGGVSNNTSSDENDEANKQQLSFHYSRYYNCALGAKRKDYNHFFFESDVTLENNTTDQNKDNPFAPKPTNTNHMIQSVLLSLPLPLPGKKCLPNEIKKLLNSFQVEFGNCDDKNSVVNEINNCQFQATCGPDAFRREMFNLNKHKNYFDTFAKDKVEEEFKRFYLNKDFPKINERKENFHYNAPHAKLYLCCRHGNTPGALAIALNSLLGKNYSASDNNDDMLFNITFFINYFTFDPTVVYSAIYGFLKKPGCRNEIKGIESDVIERILICPISDDEACNNSWLEYAKTLHTNLNPRNVKFRLMQYNNSNNILICRNDFPPCEIKKKASGGHPEGKIPDMGCDICRKYWYVGEKNWH